MNIRTKIVPTTQFETVYLSKSGKRLTIEALNNRGQLGNHVCPDMATGLSSLLENIQVAGGIFYITDLFRTWKTQADLRARYDAGTQKAFAAKPGGSFHSAGRAIDISLHTLQFQGIEKEHWLQKLWDIAKPLGFYPIIKTPNINASEAWHFDFPGEWTAAYKSLPYDEVAKCAILDVGQWELEEPEDKKASRFIQAQLIRLGHWEIGKVDGIIGVKTKEILTKLNLYDLSKLDAIANVLKDL